MLAVSRYGHEQRVAADPIDGVDRDRPLAPVARPV